MKRIVLAIAGLSIFGVVSAQWPGYIGRQGVSVSGALTNGNTIKSDANGNLVDSGRSASTDGTKLDGLPSSALSDVGCGGTTSPTGRGRINLVYAAGTAGVGCADNAGTNSKDVTITLPGFPMQFMASTGNPADASTYFFGCAPIVLTGVTASGAARCRIPRAGTINTISLNIGVGGTLGSNETSTVSFRLNNTTDTTISSAVVATAAHQSYLATALAITVTTSDYFEIKWVTPTWTTNPTNVVVSGTIIIE